MPSARRAVIALTGAAIFMVVLDNLIVLATLPTIQHGLHASLASLEWVIDAYILAFAVLVLTGAALGERYGRRRVFRAGLVLFTAASAAAGMAPDATVLIAARVAQGIGAAVLTPLTLTLLVSAFPPERRASVLGLWSAISGLGVALGPMAGGLLASGLSWHWIFWVNVPVGTVAALATPRVLPESHGRADPVDGRGLVLASAGLLGVVWAVVRGNPAGWLAASTIGAFVLGAALIAAFVAWELRCAHPMLPMRLFAARRFRAANGAAFLLHFAMFGTFFLVIQFLAHVCHQSPVTCGLWTLPWTAMPLAISPLAGRFARRGDPAAPTRNGLALIALGIAGIALLVAPDTRPAVLIGPLLLIGLGIGLALPNLVAIAMDAVDPADLGKASGALNTTRQLGSVFGIAVPVAVFEAYGSYRTPHTLIAGLIPALATTALAALAGAVLLVRGRRVLSAFRRPTEPRTT